MQTYLLAANLFALTALLLGLNDFSRGRHRWRLIPLFLLVISRSLSLILFLRVAPVDRPATAIVGFAALEVFSTLCLVWVLVNPLPHAPPIWQKLAWLGGGVALLLSLFPLFADWPVPYQLHSLTIAVFGASLILVSLGQISWIHLAGPVVISLANFLSLLEVNNVPGLLILLAYAFLIGALHWESLQTYRGRQRATEAIAQEAVDRSRERQRLLEVSEIISAVPGLSESMAHVARSMAHITHADQAAILILDVKSPDRIRPAAIYSPEQPANGDARPETAVKLAQCPPLHSVVDTQQQMLLDPHRHKNELKSLYTLWGESRLGPTLIQPLLVQGQPVGALVLGNPVSNQPLAPDDQALCRSLASQIAIMVEAYRRYFDLEGRVEEEAAAPKKAEPEPRQEVPPRPQVTPQPAARPQPEPQPVLASAGGSTGAQAPARSPSPSVPVAVAAPPMTQSLSVAPDVEIKLQDYLKIIEAVPDGVVVSDVRGRLHLVNNAAERILGKSRRDLLAQPIGTLYGEIISSETIEELATSFSRRNDPLPTFIENDDRVIQGQLIPWRNAQREWLGIIAIFRDVTPQVKADRARNDFIAAFSRVLRGPLTLIKGYAELITNGELGNYSPEQLHVQRIIHSSAERVVQILDNAIQISNQSKHKTVPRFEEVDVQELIREVIMELTPLAQLHELELAQEIKTDLPAITADSRHLYIILRNLITNACRFTPPGGHVTVQAWVQQERQGNLSQPYLQLAVIDTGVGIPPIEHKRIFDPFYRLENQNPQSPNNEVGMGMGLAVVKELVEVHNGRVWVESMEGTGSIFQVSLPVQQK